MTIKNTETKEVLKYRPETVEQGLRFLLESVKAGQQICGHNVINYDIPAIEKVYPWFQIPRDLRYLVVDTLVLSQLIYTNLRELDLPLLRSGKLPGKLYKRHSLRAWGYRLGVLKGDFALHVEEDEEKWAVFSEEMLDYNAQDVEVTEALLERILAKAYSQQAIELEHKTQWLISQQGRNGFPFDVFKAKELEMTLRGATANLAVDLQKVVPPIPDKDFIPKRDNKARGYKAGVPVKKFKEFNPNSRQQIEWIITKFFGYQPTDPDLYNVPDDTDPETIDDSILAGKIPLAIDDDMFKFLKEDKSAPEELRKLAAIFEDYLMHTKRLGQLVDGTQGWLKHVKSDGRIHGSITINGAVTGRASHSHPNIAQVPKVVKTSEGIQKGKPGKYGWECRELFHAPPGWLQVGVDASGLELRCLAHFMYPFDGGSYADAVINGDVHTLNQQAAGLSMRDMAKTFVYAYLYGAGDAKIGKIVGGTKADGKRLKRDFLAKTPALKNLKESIETALVLEMHRGRVKKWRRRYLKGLDGRLLHIRSLHAALNTLLQSAGALICKQWLVFTEEMMVEKGYRHGWDGDFAFMAWVHDEFQAAARTQEIAEDLVRVAQEAMRKTQEHFGFRVQLDTEGKIGQNWAMTH